MGNTGNLVNKSQRHIELRNRLDMNTMRHHHHIRTEWIVNLIFQWTYKNVDRDYSIAVVHTAIRNAYQFCWRVRKEQWCTIRLIEWDQLGVDNNITISLTDIIIVFIDLRGICMWLYAAALNRISEMELNSLFHVIWSPKWKKTTG